MHEIFHSSRRPFFGSTRIMSLPPIYTENYSFFIEEKFAEHKRRISREAVSFVLDLTHSRQSSVSSQQSDRQQTISR